MKICFNARNMTYGSGGTARWSGEIFEAFQLFPELDIRPVAPNFSIFGRGVGGYFWEQFILPFRLKSTEILFSPSNVGPLIVKNQVLVIHDLLPISNAREFSKLYSHVIRIFYGILVTRCRSVLTVSNDVQKKISSEFPISTSRISVVGGGISPSSGNLLESEGHRRSFCVIVGGHIGRKNLSFLLDIWPTVFASTGCKLVSIERLKADKTLTNYSVEPNFRAEWFSKAIDVSDAELAVLYSQSRFVLQPSLGEGFGLPLLEGMNLGTPFISNCVGVAEEICVGESKVINLDPISWMRYLVQQAALPKTSAEMKVQKDAASEHSWHSVATRIFQMLQRL